MPLGTIITGDETPSTSEFSFVVRDKSVKKGQYVQAAHGKGTLFGFISEIFKSNRYFERAESVAEFEKGAGMSTQFPSDSWEYTIALVKILGVFNEGRFERAFSPPSPGTAIQIAQGGLLRSFLGFNEGGLNLGSIEHHDVLAQVSMTRLLQKHLAILAMSGAGKSHLACVLLEELLARKKEDGRVAIVVIDIHGEYLGFAHDPVFGASTTVVEGGDIAIPLKRVSPETIMEWLPYLSAPQREVLRHALSSLRQEKKVEDGYSFKDLILAIDSADVSKDEVKRALKRSLGELRRYKFLSKKTENPKLASQVRPGRLLVLDFSTIDSLRKKQILVSLMARRLFSLRKKNKIPPFMLLIEEAHNFAREKAEESQAVSRAIIETIAREGRKFGASLCLISQRPVNLSTTALSQCVTPDTMIELNPGNSKNIGDLEKDWQNTRIISYDTAKNKNVSARISNYIKQNPKEIGIRAFDVRSMETNRGITATEDHPFWVRGKGWVPLKDIVVGEKVAVKPQQTPYYTVGRDLPLLDKEGIMHYLPPTINKKRLSEALQALSLLPLSTMHGKLPILARLLGHIFGDGTLHPPYKNPDGQHLLRITFSGNEMDLREIQEDLTKLGFRGSWKISRDFRESSCNFQKYGMKQMRGYTTYFKTDIAALWLLLRALGAPMGSKVAQEVRIPDWIMHAPLSIKREFLASYFGSEAQKIRMGRKSAEQVVVPFSKHEHLTENAEEYCNDLLMLLNEFDVKASISCRDYTVSQNKTKSKQYAINIKRNRKNIINFCRNVGYRYSPERQVQARLVLAYQEALQGMLDKKAMLWADSKKYQNASEIETAFGIPREEAKSLLRTKKKIKLPAKSVPSFEEWCAEATRGLNDGLVWETIGTKRLADADDVRDITIPEYHSFFANGFLTHNCNTHIILRVTNPNDLDHIQMSSEGIDARTAKSISGLKVGEAIIVGEAVNYPIFISVRGRKSVKREKGAPLDRQAIEFEEKQEKRERNAEAFI